MPCSQANKAVSRVKGAPQRREGRLTIQAVAGSDDEAVERMRSLASVRGSLAGTADAGTLKARPDLDVLRAMPASAAGFLSIAGLASWFRSDWSNDGLLKARESLIGLSTLTDQGATPVPLSLSATRAAGGPGGDVRLRLVFPIRLGLEVAASPHSIF